ncbi:MAG: hypothetical protein Q4B28_02315 [bacterium]|nr:hypothetical protein [bacterium]
MTKKEHNPELESQHTHASETADTGSYEELLADAQAEADQHAQEDFQQLF